jgi:cellobiose phosphorylase
LPEVKLLSNGRYHVMVTSEGSGFSRWNDLAVTRWREDSVLDPGGSYLYVRDLDAGLTGSATARPVGAGSGAVEASFDPGTARFHRLDHQLELTTTVAVAADADVELRRLLVVNRSPRARHLQVTSLADIVLAPPAADRAHPAFSKLFVETEFVADVAAIVATRRPSAPDDPRVWCVHTAVVHGQASVPLTFETDRLRFIGRGRDACRPAALQDDRPLSGCVGPVLDAIAAMRVPIVLEAGASCTIDWYMGAAATRADALALARRQREPEAGDAVLEKAGRAREALLQRIGAGAADAIVYERLAAALLYTDREWRGPAETIAANRRGQSDLWRFGISGDMPVVLLEVADASDVGGVRQIVRAQAFWNAHGLPTEVMILSGSADAASPDLLEQVQRVAAEGEGAARIGKRGGVFIRDAAAIDAADRTLLARAARVVARATSHGLSPSHLRSTGTPTALQRSAGVVAPPAIEASDAHVAAAARPAVDATDGLRDSNGFGGYAPDGREYVIVTSVAHATPAPWVNVIANPGFGTLISESGSATTWSENAQQFRLTPWSNDPVADPSSEAFYIRDEDSGRFWSPTRLPCPDEDSYVACHGFGYSMFEHAHADIRSELRVFVAADAPVKLSALSLRNRSDRVRRLSVTGYVEWVLGDERDKTLMHVVTERDAATGALFARNGYNTDFDGRTAFFDVDGEGDARSDCCDRADFFGPCGTRATPDALRRPALDGRVGAGLDPCAALRVTLVLEPGARREVVFRLGCGASTDAARALVLRFRGADATEAALGAVKASWDASLRAVEVKTPDAAIDALANGWLTYQVIGSRLWGRNAFYQSSGAFGFRDQLQDVMALVHAAPGLVREHLLRAASRQFVEGDVQHWWHPPAGRGIRSRCSDDFLWLPFAIARYVEATGDAAVLDVDCPFLEGRALRDGEGSDYALPTVSAEVASLYEHGARAVRHGLRFGARGLPLMGTGDWNDGMNRVGEGGKGESVWLAFFLVTVLKRYAPVARARGDSAFAEQCEREASALGARTEAVAWDGDWYRRAWFDDGTPLGTAAAAECRIDSIAQSWAVLSGVASDERARRALDALHAHLVHADTRLVQLLEPPFDTSRPSPGYIQGYVPGVRENGGQYTHAAVWAAIAFAARGDAARAWELFALLAPMHHGASAADITTYKVEPYVVAGDVYAGAHAGRGGWTWYTGSAGWMLQLVLEWLLGLERRGNQLRLRPLLPKDWKGFEMRYRFGASTYDIDCRADANASAEWTTVDGTPAPDGWVTLVDDGRTHAVVVDTRGRGRDVPARLA